MKLSLNRKPPSKNISRRIVTLLGLALVPGIFSGCQLFQRSEAWDTIMHSQIPGRGDQAGNRTYAGELRHLLNEKRIENKLVTFRYSVGTRSGPIVVQRSAVIYRDPTTPTYPWWLMDNFRSAPTWLPNEPLENQVAFAERLRFVEIVSTAKARPAELERKFRRLHGTSFDPESALDRRKMAALENGED
ncbi:MAG: hypothetical protein QOD99_1630 [Chthoniobacter sp.]|jgi:hypothetical protein|nr:hypothetical protein [Chthoniobacter sp.]